MKIRWVSKCGKFRIVVGAYGEPTVEHYNDWTWGRVYSDQAGTLRIDAFEAMMHSLALERAYREAIEGKENPCSGLDSPPDQA